MASGYRKDIDGLRAVAVLSVVLNHAGLPGVPGGYVGVDVFFVISGYLISQILLREIAEERLSLAAFYERRARRILPALFVVLAACLLGGWFLLLPAEYTALAQSTTATLLFVSNVWFWLGTGDYFHASVAFEPLLHTWSLAVEEQFYLLYPLLLMAVARWPRRKWGATIAVLTLSSFALSVWALRHESVAGFYLAPTRAWELGIGALLALYPAPERATRSSRHAAAVLGLCLICGSVVLFSGSTPFPGVAALAPCVGAALVIWAGAVGQTVVGRLLSYRGLVFIGLISYSLYLWHWPVLVTARLIAGQAELPVGTAILCTAVSCAMAWGSWRFVERPFRRQGALRNISRPKVFTAATSSAALLICMALLVSSTDGFANRVPPDVLQVHAHATARGEIDIRCRSPGPGHIPCPIGAQQQPPEVLVWGDSHAGAMLPGVSDWLESFGQGGVAMVRNACAPLLGVARLDGSDGSACAAHNHSVQDYLEAHTEIRTVILVARWPLLVEGTRPAGEAGALALLSIDGEPGHPVGNARAVAHGLSNTLRWLRTSGREVILIGSVPEIGFHVPKALARSRFAGTQMPAPPSRAAFDVRSARADALLLTAAIRHDARLVRPSDVLCSTKCRILDGERPLYFDDDHLSPHAARNLVPGWLDSAREIRTVAQAGPLLKQNEPAGDPGGPAQTRVSSRDSQ
ncbi:peptidoglycan/LPS O-acetylase OafA/YrhL [Aliiruegeria haliotis]|uniref:Peptidoglycan/LPS O-acetylase OafA/YrhL n=1 Tax=Aliiruegeria haliotis TaxID=1280846 RepID=A0A2T0RHU2_9RHOB|nr:acyltransferase family protein [Aliiruegeria haliotis]PRY20719.1 peptidoglycan/LPS O-acetylase OafA/YrhL [Aliiruegeria haliotis]